MANEFNFDDTSQIQIPLQLIGQVIGQEEASNIAKIVAKQKRNLLLVGAPGTGKSMIGRAIAQMLGNAHTEISLMHNPTKPERPLLEARGRAQVMQKEKSPSKQKKEGSILRPTDVPSFVSERLGFKCKNCSSYSSPNTSKCPSCKAEKYRQAAGPFEDLLSGMGDSEREDVVHTTRVMNGKEELVLFERFDDFTIRALDQKDLTQMNEAQGTMTRNVIVPLGRSLFVQATGASETELLGDVRHDPYGGHHQIGTPAYTRVIPGAVHEAHEGVLFIDEIVSLGSLQRHLLTAMQDKKFPITGRNASSTGAAVRVDDVPCDFILISAINLGDLDKILPPLRSRIAGNGYELVVNSYMDDTAENRQKIAQFVAQEVRRDGKIPHASKKAVEAVLAEAKRRAKIADRQNNAISLRLRALSGIVKTAGDWASQEGSLLIEPKHVALAIKKGKAAEEQMSEKYGSVFNAAMSDWASTMPAPADKNLR
ncbi:peptidase [Candidatus Micrarchaeota archaeon CG10_big_fil_rev_8_21_14_0_10_45_29]|nr:MAG: peptidase [Candidatus Micrarchaeota archaeon CG10_big_fil_rev_8_21_14_0_10_45_29]